MILYLGFYILGRVTLMVVPWMWPASEGNAKASIGCIKFYGPKSFVEQCLKAVKEDLVRYDPILQKHLLNESISLCFYAETKHYISYPSVGLFAIPEKIWCYESEGICQHIIFRYLQSLELGFGLVAALRDDSTKHRIALFQAREKMITWLKKTDYPKGWADTYKVSSHQEL